MKIGLVCPYNIYKGGGVQECVRAMQAELAKRGHDVKILAPLPREIVGKPPKDVIFIGGATDFKSPFGTTTQLSVSFNGDIVDEVLEREQFDILHFHEPWVPVVSRQILSRSTSKNVATFHAKLPERRTTKTIERVVTPYTKSIMKYLDSLTAVSESAASYVRTLTQKQINIIPNGIDLAKYQAKSSQLTANSSKKLLFIGRLEKRKGVKYLLQAFALLKASRPGIKLIIAGDGPDRFKLEQLAEELGTPGVSFIGHISEPEKIKLLHSADLFCSPALYGESFGIVLLEAMAAGIPLVAGNNPGYMDVMAGRGHISLVDPKDTAEFAERLELLLYDTELRTLWQSWAASYIKQFTYHKVVDKYEELYKKIL